MTSCRLLSSCCFQIIGTIWVESISATFLPIYLHLSIYWSACLCVETIPTIYDKYIYIYRLYISYSIILLGFFVQPSMWLHLNIHTCLRVQVGSETKNTFNVKQSIPPTVALAMGISRSAFSSLEGPLALCPVSRSKRHPATFQILSCAHHARQVDESKLCHNWHFCLGRKTIFCIDVTTSTPCWWFRVKE